MWVFAYNLLYVPSFSQVGVTLLINLVVLSSTLFPHRVPNVRSAWHTCAVANSYLSGSLAGACQFLVSSDHYSIGKRVSCISVSYSFDLPVDGDSMFIRFSEFTA
jgi:hypothetical protein